MSTSPRQRFNVHGLLAALALCMVLSPYSECCAQPQAQYPGDWAGQLEAMAQTEFATLTTLTETASGNPVSVLQVGTGDARSKRAVAVVGSVHASHLLGGELALMMAKKLVDQAAEDASILNLTTFYFIPFPNPDASLDCFAGCGWENNLNSRSDDLDDDFRVDEDGYDDLNGDGVITMMRVEWPGGAYRTHPADQRVMIKAEVLSPVVTILAPLITVPASIFSFPPSSKYTSPSRI